MLRTAGHSTAAREKVRLARNDLELSIFYRQLDVMANRFQPRKTWAEKNAWLKHKGDLLAFGKEVILAEHRRDCDDRERIRKGETVAVARKKELVSACSSHLFQLDMRLEAMQALHALLLCQVCPREKALALHCVSDVFDLLVRVRWAQVSKCTCTRDLGVRTMDRSAAMTIQQRGLGSWTPQATRSAATSAGRPLPSRQRP